MHKTFLMRRFNGRSGDEEQMLTVFIFLGSRHFSGYVAVDRRNFGCDSVDSAPTYYADEMVLSPDEDLSSPPRIKPDYWCNWARHLIKDLVGQHISDDEDAYLSTDGAWMVSFNESDFEPDKWTTYHAFGHGKE